MANSSNSSEARIYDLKLEAGFHRNRRTMLLFASGALVVSISQSAGDSQVMTGLYGNVQIERHVAWGLLWGASLYYAIGFAIDAVAAGRQISKFAIRHSKEGVDAAIDALAGSLLRSAQRLDQALMRPPFSIRTNSREIGQEAFYSALMQSARAGTPTWIPDEELSDTALAQLAPSVVEKLQPALGERVAHLRAYMEEISNRNDELEPLIHQFRDEVDIATHLLAGVKRDLGQLSPRIIAERRWQFWLWEVASPFTFLALVTLVGSHLLWRGVEAVAGPLGLFFRVLEIAG